MGDDFRKYLRGGEARLGGLKEEKKNKIRAIAILILSMGVFFYPESQSGVVSANVSKNFPCQFEKSFWCEKKTDSVKKIPTEEAKPKVEISLDELTPEKKLGTFVYKKTKDEQSIDHAHCSLPKKNVSVEEMKEKSVFSLVAGHPIEKMIPFIEKRNREVASFLVAIAKKESNWGVHSPQKFGRECYNYWGYRGTYNQTQSGYSCFDSPEQAVQEVGDKIEKLLSQQINTPSRMIVWKCGRTCAGHDPAGVAKWISDVALYYGKLNS